MLFERPLTPNKRGWASNLEAPTEHFFVRSSRSWHSSALLPGSGVPTTAQSVAGEVGGG